jgi:hypothetical protein
MGDGGKRAEKKEEGKVGAVYKAVFYKSSTSFTLDNRELFEILGCKNLMTKMVKSSMTLTVTVDFVHQSAKPCGAHRKCDFPQ